MQNFANGSMTTGSYKVACTGMIKPILEMVPAEASLYRFVDINRGPSAQQANGAWWFEHETFQNIKHFADRGEYTLDYAARLFFAVLHEYSGITGYVKAKTLMPLRVWRGRGSVQYRADSKVKCNTLPLR